LPSTHGSRLLYSAGIASGLFLSILDHTQDPHLLDRFYFQVAAHGDPVHRYPGFPFRLSRGNGQLATPGPSLGAHNREILCDLLGLPEDRIPQIDEAISGTSFDPLVIAVSCRFFRRMAMQDCSSLS
jgi:crotonobetainyl-CoA:carnitine CoA-transferase CaiB-like acyl-CoA transferase